MITVRISSGLGNQLFQYAFYNLMKETYPDTEVYADVTTWFNKNNEHNGYELENIFGDVEGSSFEIRRATASVLWKTMGIIPNMSRSEFGKKWDRIIRYPNRIIREFTEKSTSPFHIDQMNDSFANDSNCFFEKVMNLDTSKNWMIDGYYIEEKYYGQVIDLLKSKLVFPPFEKVILSQSKNGNKDEANSNALYQIEKNIEYAEGILSSYSVSIHVRRGDYLSDFYKDRFISLGEDYYKRAVNYINTNVSNDAKFFIFSDDKDFVEKAFDWIENKVVVTGNEGVNSFKDMQLMSLCRHNIIANSTFSQWGALLNCNENHLTIYPKAYMVDKDNEVKNDKNWIRM